jgi:hypothetical protein
LSDSILKYLLFLPLLAVWRCPADGAPCGLETRKTEIKQMDKNSLAAKQKALSTASREVFRKLVTEKLGRDPGIFPKISDDQIQECIHDYSIENEKYSDSYYIAELSYRFSMEKISDLMKTFGLDLGYSRKSESSEVVKIAVYADDFLRQTAGLEELGATVKSFSSEMATFTINGKDLDGFRQLRIRYARLP